MRSRSIIVAGLAATLAICAVAVPLAQASSDDPAGDDHGRTARHFEGRVTSANLERQTFRIRRNRGATVRFTVTARTRFERIAGFAGLRRGLPVEVTARRLTAAGSRAGSSRTARIEATTAVATAAITATTDPPPAAGGPRRPPLRRMQTLTGLLPPSQPPPRELNR